MSAARTAVEDAFAASSQCWCCGTVDDPTLMIHLGNHPEVALCRRCARWAAKQAAEIDDRANSGPLVAVRDRFRKLRRAVIDRGWHRSKIIGRPLRWLGNHLP